MAHRAYYPYPPMPQRSVPPRVTVPIFPADPTGDVVPPGVNASLAVLAWYKPKRQVQRVYTRIAALLPTEDLTGDIPPLLNLDTLFRILNTRPFIPLPKQKQLLHPILIGNPEDTIPPIRFDGPLQVLYKYNAFLVPFPRQKRRFLREELPAAPSRFFGRLIAFQPDAFQIGYPGNPAFQGFNRALRLQNLSVDDFLTIYIYTGDDTSVKQYRKGSSILIRCRVYDPTESPSRLVDPDAVLLTILNPDESVLIESTGMYRISEGHYSYIHQSILTDQSGPYLLNVFSSIATNSDRTLDQVGFILV